jgi:hypothetical protein
MSMNLETLLFIGFIALLAYEFGKNKPKRDASKERIAKYNREWQEWATRTHAVQDGPKGPGSNYFVKSRRWQYGGDRFQSLTLTHRLKQTHGRCGGDIQRFGRYG